MALDCSCVVILFLVSLFSISRCEEEYVLAASDVCLSATSYMYGYEFHAPYGGEIIGIQLTHKSGGVTSWNGRKNGNWGSGVRYRSDETESYNAFKVEMIEVDIGTVYPTITTERLYDFRQMSCTNGNECSIYSYHLHGYNSATAETFELRDTKNPKTVSTSQTFSIQMGEGCCGVQTHDNIGSTCADVHFIYLRLEPTSMPTSNPTSHPSNIPTSAPTSSPSQSPTSPTPSPSSDPTTNPTFEPTLEPTTPPTRTPSDSPSSSPTPAPSVSPTLAPTAAPSTEAELLKKYVDDRTYFDELNTALYGTLFSIPSFCICTSVIVYKFECIYRYVQSLFFRVDNQSYLSVILYFVQMTDMSSDIYFVYQLYCYHSEMKYGHIAVQENVEKATKDTVYILFLSALAFTIVPYLLNFFSSIRIIWNISTDHTINEYTKAYFKRSDQAYSVFTLLSGGSFYTLKLINSNFFGLRVFQAGMSQMMVEKYASHKIVFTTVLENVPQLLIQSVFVIKLKMLSSTVIIASLSSVFNILLSVMSASIVNSTHKNEVEILFKFNLSWKKKEEKEDDDEIDPFAMTGQRKKLSTALCQLEAKNNFEFEILSSQKKEQTATIYGVIKCEETCVDKKSNIRLFLDKHLKKSVMESFGYNEAAFENMVFGLSYVVGEVHEFTLSGNMKQYLPMIWKYVDWNDLKKNEKRINDHVIIDLTEEVESLNRQEPNVLLDVEEEKDDYENNADSDNAPLKLK